MSVAWAVGAWATNSWVGMNAGPPNAWRGATSPTVTVDTHDGIDRALKRENEEFKARRDKLRAQLLEVVGGVTKKPPPLDAPLKQLATIAKKASGFDYAQALKDIEEIEARGRETEAAREKRLAIEDENEVIVSLLLH